MAIQVRAHHVSFAITNLERSRAFYEGVLGLQQKPRPDFGIPGVWYQAGACEVHLIEKPAGLDTGSPPPNLSPLANHAAFGVASYKETLAHLKAHGLEVLETNPDVGQMWVHDPDGYIIELIVDHR